jgi:hypothetical protein
MRSKLSKPFVSILAVFSFLTANSQDRITGTVKDTLARTGVASAAVVLIRAQDSIIENFARTNPDGKFEINGVPQGAHILIVSLSGYADFFTQLSTTASAGSKDLGVLVLSPRSTLMEEVIVRQRVIAVRMRGDTTEYVADSFKVQPNASVEDLLKQLPGLSVDRNGNITAYGEQVKKVLVDGEEFFGDDPTLVTHALRADMVKKVQVYDRQKDLLSDSGDPLSKEKTINLQLKEESKHGNFGKVYGGMGSSGFFENQAMFNEFKERMKFSAYGLASNTGVVGLGGQDMDKYGIKESMSMSVQNDLNTWSGNYEGKGIPQMITGGLHYNNTFHGKHFININYKASSLNLKGLSSSLSEVTLPSSRNFLTSSEDFTDKNNRHDGSVRYKTDIDSLTTFEAIVEGYVSDKTVNNHYGIITKNETDLLNSGTRSLLNSNHEGLVYARPGLERRMKKRGRVLLLNAQFTHDNNRSDGFINSVVNYTQPSGSIDSTQVNNFNRISSAVFNQMKYQAKYIEPVFGRTTLSISYDLTREKNKSGMQTLNRDASGGYSIVDTNFSRVYDFKRTGHEAGMYINYNSKKIIYTLGGALHLQQFNQADKVNGTSLNRNFKNLNLKGEFVYLFSLQRKINMYYTGAAVAPLVFQVQPLISNADPLNIYLGNALLRPAYAHTIGIGYNYYETATQRYLFTNVNFSAEKNHITTAIAVDSGGRNSYMYVNVNGYARSWGYLGVGKPFGKNTNAGFNFSFQYERNPGLINKQLNKLTSGSYDFELYANTIKQKHYSTGIRMKSARFTNQSSLDFVSAYNSHFWIHEISPMVEVYLPGHLIVHSDAVYYLRKTAVTFQKNLNSLIWNAWIGKALVDNALMLKLSCHDILDQNTGFSNFTYNNFITQTNYSTIGRYLMFSVNWDFNKTMAGSAKKQQP